MPVVRWQKDNDHLSLTSNEKYEVTASGSLIISEVEYLDEGTYECAAENLAGVEQAFAVLTIRGGSIELELLLRFINYYLFISLNQS